jgi:hypothetical protein
MADDEFYYVGGGDRVRGRSAMQCIDDADVLRWASGLLRDSLAAEVWSNVRRIGWVSADSCDARGVHVGTSVGSEQSVPEEVNHRKIGVRVQMVDKVKLLLAPEPSEACEVRSFGVICFVQYTCAPNDAALAALITTNRLSGRTTNIPAATRIVGRRK